MKYLYIFLFINFSITFVSFKLEACNILSCNYSFANNYPYGGYGSYGGYGGNSLFGLGASGQVQLQIPPLGGHQFGYAGQSFGILGAGLLRDIGEGFFGLFSSSSSDSDDDDDDGDDANERSSGGGDEYGSGEEFDKITSDSDDDDDGDDANEGSSGGGDDYGSGEESDKTTKEKIEKEQGSNKGKSNKIISCPDHKCKKFVKESKIENQYKNGGTIAEYDNKGHTLARCDLSPDHTYDKSITTTPYCDDLAAFNEEKSPASLSFSEIDDSSRESDVCTKTEKCEDKIPSKVEEVKPKTPSPSQTTSPCNPFPSSEDTTDLAKCISASQKTINRSTLYTCDDDKTPTKIKCESLPTYGAVVAEAFDEITTECFVMDNQEKKNLFQILNHESRFHINALEQNGWAWSMGIGQITGPAISDVKTKKKNHSCLKETFDLSEFLGNKKSKGDVCKIIQMNKENLKQSLYLSAQYLKVLEGYIETSRYSKVKPKVLSECKQKINKNKENKAKALAGGYHSGYLGGLLFVCDTNSREAQSAKKYNEKIKNDLKELKDNEKKCRDVDFL